MKIITHRIILVAVIFIILIIGHGYASDTVQDFDKIGEYLKNMALDSLFGGEDYKSIIDVLGKPLEIVPNDEYYRLYFKHGVEVDVATDNDFPVVYNYIYISPDSDLMINAKIGIDSSRQQVIDIYDEMINYGISSDDFLFAGTIDIGIIFQLKDDKVYAIFIALGRFTSVDIKFPNR